MMDADNETSSDNSIIDKLFSTISPLSSSINTLDGIFKYIFFLKLILFVVGMSGNIFCIIIWMKKDFIRMPRSSACIVLAISDSLFLMTSVPNNVVKYINNGETNLLFTNEFFCRLMITTFGISQLLDSWMIVTLTVERFCAVVRPYFFSLYFTRKNIGIVVAIISSTIIAMSLYASLGDTKFHVFPNGKQVCLANKGLFNEIRAIIYGTIPLIIVIPCNLIIMVKLYQQKRRMKLLTQSNALSDEKKSYNITVMILSVTVSYSILILPYSIYLTCCQYSATASGLLSILSTIPELNASINFYLYFMSSQIFKNEVKKQLSKMFLFCGCKQIGNNLVVPVESGIGMAGSTSKNEQKGTLTTGFKSTSGSKGPV